MQVRGAEQRTSIGDFHKWVTHGNARPRRRQPGELTVGTQRQDRVLAETAPAIKDFEALAMSRVERMGHHAPNCKIRGMRRSWRAWGSV